MYSHNFGDICDFNKNTYVVLKYVTKPNFKSSSCKGTIFPFSQMLILTMTSMTLMTAATFAFFATTRVSVK